MSVSRLQREWAEQNGGEKEWNAPIPQGPVTDKRDQEYIDAVLNDFASEPSQPDTETNEAKGLDGAVFKIARPYSPILDLMGVPEEWTPAWNGRPIPIESRETVAVAAGLGDLIGDPWRGIKQAMSKKDPDGMFYIDEQSQNQNEEIMDNLYDNNAYGAYAGAGAVVGSIVEPIGILTGVGKFKTVAQAAMFYGITGGLYGATFYVDEQESRMTNAAWGFLLGAGIGGAANKLIDRFTRHAAGSDLHKIMTDAGPAIPDVNHMKADVPGLNEHLITKSQYMKQGKEHFTRARTFTDKAKELGDSPEAGGFLAKADWELERAEQLLKEMETAPSRKPRTSKKAQTTETVLDMEARAAMEGPRLSKMERFQRQINYATQPIYDQLRRIPGGANLAMNLRKVDQQHHSIHTEWSDITKPLVHMARKIQEKDPAAYKVLHDQLMMNGLDKDTFNMIKAGLGKEGYQAAKDIEKLMAKVLSDATDVGYNLGKVKNYWPHQVKDLDGLHKNMQPHLAKIISQAEAKAKKSGKDPLTQKQKDEIIERSVSFDPRFSNTAGNLKTRLTKELKESNIPYYYDAFDGLDFYLNSMAEDIAKRRFFRDYGHKPGKDGLDVTGADLDKSVASVIDTIVGGIPAKHLGTVEDILRGMFSSNVHKTNFLMQGAKNLSVASTLGNFWSAATQSTDSIFSIHRHGIINAVQAMFGPNVTNKEMMGITKALVELNSEKALTASLTDWSLKWSGFNLIDAFGKNVNLNAAVRKNQKNALSTKTGTTGEKFIKQWGEYFGDETPALMKEFQDLKLVKGAPMSENMKLVLWSELAESQPIGMAETPLRYLQFPNGRVVYQYKTFTMKQINYFRNIMQNKHLSYPERAKQVATFAAMFVAAGSTVDAFKDFMAGKDVEIDDILLDNILGLVGTNKYIANKNAGAVEIATNFIIPVWGRQAYDAAVALFGEQGDITPGDFVNALPVGGKVNKVLQGQGMGIE